MNGHFPALRLPITPPLPPLEGRAVATLPSAAGLLFEPLWDGLRCLVFRDARTVVLQSAQGEPLTRYFPELLTTLTSVPRERFALDGTLVAIGDDGRIHFEDLLLRLHPSARRVAQLSARSPVTLLATDLLAEGDDAVLDLPLGKRRERLERFFDGVESEGLRLSPATRRRPEALGWLRQLEGAGIDGLIARRLSEPYRSARRDAAVESRPSRTAACVVGGVRRSQEGAVISLLLGLQDEGGLLHYVGTALLPPAARKGVEKLVDPLVEPPGFTGATPGSEARASHGKTRDFDPLRPALCCEVRFEHFTEARFREEPAFLRWLPGRAPRSCTFDQVRPTRTGGQALDLLGH